MRTQHYQKDGSLIVGLQQALIEESEVELYEVSDSRGKCSRRSTCLTEGQEEGLSFFHKERDAVAAPVKCNSWLTSNGWDGIPYA